MFHLKNFNIGKTATKITAGHNSTEGSHYELKKIEALLILLGGYNQLGRHIPIKEYESLKNRFEELITDTIRFGD